MRQLPGVLNQIRVRDGEMRRIHHAGDLEQPAQGAAGGEHQVKRIARRQAMA